MRRAWVSMIVVFFLTVLVSAPSTNSTISPSYSDPNIRGQITFSIERNWTANIVLVNYDDSIIDKSVLLSGLPTERVYATSMGYIKYWIEYNVYFASSLFVTQLTDVILDNSMNGTDTGTCVNETSLLYQQANPDEPQTIFYSRDGRKIDGYVIEDWLEDNPVIDPPDLGYTLYLFNFSSLDSSGHSLEHWYDYHPIDPDTGQSQNWFRLEWDNELNPDVSLDYPFFGGRYNSFIVDPSAHQWYLKWCRIWWSSSISTEYNFWTKDLEDILSEIDVESPAGITALNVYLRECIWDPITQLFFPYQHQPAKYVESGLLRSLVFCMDVDEGISIDSLTWITDAEMQKTHLEELYPFITWDVQVDFLDIDDHLDWNNTFWADAIVEPNGTVIADGYNMFYAIYDDMRPLYIDVDDENINVFGVVFIKQQMEMHYFGLAYTGLGGGGQTVIWKSHERYYRPDGVTQKDGISSVQLHETMHAVGFHHTWQHEHYASDFCYSPMGYFAFHNGTSTFDKNWVQGTYLDQMEIELFENFTTEQENVGPDERAETYLAESNAISSFNRVRTLYDKMDWLGAFDALCDARDWTRRMKFSMLDTTPPIINDWSITQTTSGAFSLWADIADDLSGIENVSIYYQVDGAVQEYSAACVYNGSHWIGTISSTSASQSIISWIKVWDWGMNSAESERIRWTVAAAAPPWYLYILLFTGVALVAIVIIFVIRRR
ncbi:MAG: hypothetical protein JW779_11060 [Candidatus Thorarchaeota archaeon]|nr:hypothetical protein [Candidatus Thorarchaeota archaeon]